MSEVTTNLNGRLSVTSGAIIIALFSVLSRLLGLLRDRLLASNFGAGSVLDSYYAAFKIPDFIFNTLVLGALASAFIPVFIRLRKNSQPEAESYTQTMFNLVTGILAVCAVVAIIFAPQLVALIAPGFDPERLQLTISLTRVMLLATIFFGASNILASVLQAERKFFAYSLAPVLYNGGIIIGLYTLVPVMGTIGLAWGVVLGSALHFLVQVPAVRKLGFSWSKNFSLKVSGIKETLKLIGPRTIGLAASQLEQVITAGFATSLAVGSLAAFTLAVNLQSFPINVFGVSLAIAAFPVFSQALAVNNNGEFTAHFKDSVRRIVFFVLPLAVLFLVLRAQIVRVTLGSGVFDWGDTIRTADILGYLSLAMLADALVPLVARVFYALSDTRTPALVAVGTVVVNVILLIVFHPLGLAGIGLAYVFSRALSLSTLVALLGKRLGDLGGEQILQGLGRMLPAALLSGLSAYLMLRVIAPLVDMHTFLGIFIQGTVSGVVGVIIYLLVTWNLPEVNFVKRWLASSWTLTSKLWIRN